MSLLRSKWFIGISSLAGGFAAVYYSDRYAANQIKQKLLDACRFYGEQPMSILDSPRKITVLCVAPSYPEVQSQHRRFKRYVLPFLNEAGIDHEWVELSKKQLVKEACDASKDTAREDEKKFDEIKNRIKETLDQNDLTAWFASNWSRELRGEKAIFFGERGLPEALKKNYKKTVKNGSQVMLLNPYDYEQFKKAVDSSLNPILVDLQQPISFWSKLKQWTCNRHLMEQIGSFVYENIIRE